MTALVVWISGYVRRYSEPKTHVSRHAAWLHMRLTKGWRGAPMAWWPVAGLFVTLFAFLGVNMFLSGLHCYGEL